MSNKYTLNMTPAYGKPIITGQLKLNPEDFWVSECLGFEPEGEGEHIYCWVEKSGHDTAFIAKQLAKFAEVPLRSVSFAGLKDRQAVTQQWFSIHIPGKRELNWSNFNTETSKVLIAKRHKKKLQRGALKANQFKIRLRNVSGEVDLLEQRINQLKQGIPNYFGQQRFGYQGQNMVKAEEFLLSGKKVKNKQLRSLLYSSVRSWLFNLELERNIKQDCWNQIRAGDIACLVGSNSYFIVKDETAAEMQQRQQDKDIVAGGLLWGKQTDSKLAEAMHQFHQSNIDHADLMQGLNAHGLEVGIRPQVMFAEDLQWQLAEDDLLIRFTLNKGSYATVLLNELCTTCSK